MKNVLSILFCCFLSGLFAQVKTEELNKNSNQAPLPATNSYEKQKPAQDSTANIERKASAKKAKSQVLKPDATAVNQHQIELKSHEFYQIKSSVNTQATQRSPTSFQQSEMDETVKFYNENSPNSFEYHYFKYVSGNYDLSLINELKEAQKLKPKNVDVQIQFAAYHFIENNVEELKKNLEFLLKTGRIEKELLIYSEDLLQSVLPNGILLTHGFDDTYSAMYLQTVNKFRTDVQIISLDFLQSSTYQKKLKNESFIIPANKTVDVTFLRDFCSLNASRKLQLSMTFPKPYLEIVQEDLQIVGLSFLYKNSGINVEQANQDFYSKSFSADKIFQFTSEKCKHLSSNYLPFLYTVKQLQKTKYAKSDKDDVQLVIDKIRNQAKVKTQIKSYH